MEERVRPAAELVEPSPLASVVSCRSLTKRYRELVAVDEVTFALEAGTVTGFLGRNGAGKTTTLRLLLGLAEPTSGEALVFGRRYRELEQPIKTVGAVLESGDFHPARSGRDHLGALALAAGLPLSRVGEVLELVELSGAADRRARTYSLGMRQRLGLAAALLGDPELLILGRRCPWPAGSRPSAATSREHGHTQCAERDHTPTPGRTPGDRGGLVGGGDRRAARRSDSSAAEALADRRPAAGLSPRAVE
jgi:ABC-type transport system involved in cytochrome c biogenesis ATPase subunit